MTWFRRKFPVTPATAVTALNDYRKDVVSGLIPMSVATNGASTPMRGGEPVVTEEGTTSLVVHWPLTGKAELVTTCTEDNLSWARAGNQWRLEMRWATGVEVPFRAVAGNKLICHHSEFNYTVECRCGTVELDLVDRCLRLLPVAGRVSLSFA